MLGHKTQFVGTIAFSLVFYYSMASAQESNSDRTGAAYVAEEALRTAARNGDVASVRRLLDEGVDFNATNEYRLTAIYYAADRGNKAIVDMLLARGAEVEIPNEPYYRLSPMIMAARKNHAEVVQSLLDAGAECGSWTAIWPASLGHTEVVKILVAARPKVYKGDSLNQLLSIANGNGNELLAEFLRDRGAVEPEKSDSPKPVFSRLSKSQLRKLDGVYQSEMDDVPTRIWSRDGDLYFGSELELASPLEQTGELNLALSESPEVTIQLAEPLGVHFTLFRDGERIEFERVSSRPVGGKKFAIPTTGARWPRFRGPDGAGNADGFALPKSFDATSNRGLP